MATVLVNVAFTDPADSPSYPAGTTTSGTQVELVVPAGATPIAPQTIAAGVTEATFDNVPPGTGYTATAQLLDGNGSLLGVLATSAAFDIEAPAVNIPTPTTVTVTVSA